MLRKGDIEPKRHHEASSGYHEPQGTYIENLLDYHALGAVENGIE